MDFTAIFQAYYTMFRADSDVPTSTDAEYTVGMRLANEAINRWFMYDNTYWHELFTTNQTDGTGDQTIVTGQKTYTAPTTMQEPGGLVKVIDGSGNTQAVYTIINPEEAQFKTDEAQYAYLTGDPVGGFTLNLNPAPTSKFNGMGLEYDFYKKPTYFTTGTDETEMSDPYFIVHRMLASQFRAARNPYYSSAKADAENSLVQMKMHNESGNWASTPVLQDNSGSAWGSGLGG